MNLDDDVVYRRLRLGSFIPASLRFVPREEMAEQGYGEYLDQAEEI